MTRKLLLRGFMIIALLTINVILTSRGLAHSWNNYHWDRYGNPTINIYNSASNGSLANDTIWEWDYWTILTLRQVGASGWDIHTYDGYYGATGWSGLARVWADGNQHFVTDPSFPNEAIVNTHYGDSAWKRGTFCQELGHTFGLDHSNDGGCMGLSYYAGSGNTVVQHNIDDIRNMYATNHHGPPPVPATDPGIVSWGPGRVDIFARGQDNALWTKWWTSAGWSGWSSLGGGVNGGADAASWGVGRLDVVVRSFDNNIYHKAFQNSWSGWGSIGAPPGGATSDPSIVAWDTGRLDVFVRGADAGLWHKWWTPAGWSGWVSLGGAILGAPDAASWAPGHLDVYARGTDNQLHHRWYQNGWSGWSSIGGALTSDPSAVSWGPGSLDVFARGSDNTLQHRHYENAWGGWESLGGGLGGGADAASWASGRLDVVVRGTDNQIHHKWYQNGWGPWTALGTP